MKRLFTFFRLIFSPSENHLSLIPSLLKTWCWWNT